MNLFTELRASFETRFKLIHPQPLPKVEISHGPVVSAHWLHALAIALLVALVALIPLRVPAPLPLTLALLIVAAGLALWFLLRPGVAPALSAIGVAAAFGLARPPSLPWALVFAALGYLAFRAGLLASQIPRDADIEVAIVQRLLLKDLLVLAVTAIAGGIGLVGQRLTGCYADGASIASRSQIDIIGETCHPAGYALTIIGGLAWLGLALYLSSGLLGGLMRKRMRSN